jgi:hypothetical protein
LFAELLETLLFDVALLFAALLLALLFDASAAALELEDAQEGES